MTIRQAEPGRHPDTRGDELADGVAPPASAAAVQLVFATINRAVRKERGKGGGGSVKDM